MTRSRTRWRSHNASRCPDPRSGGRSRRWSTRACSSVVEVSAPPSPTARVHRRVALSSLSRRPLTRGPVSTPHGLGVEHDTVADESAAAALDLPCRHPPLGDRAAESSNRRCPARRHAQLAAPPGYTATSRAIELEATWACTLSAARSWGARRRRAPVDRRPDADARRAPATCGSPAARSRCSR